MFQLKLSEPRDIQILAGQPGVTAFIIGASKIEYLEEAIAAVELKLEDKELAFLEQPDKPHPLLGHS